MAKDDRREERERAEQQACKLREAAFLAALAADLEMHQLEVLAERGAHEEVHMGAHATDRGAIGPEDEDDGTIHRSSYGDAPQGRTPTTVALATEHGVRPWGASPG